MSEAMSSMLSFRIHSILAIALVILVGSSQVDAQQGKSLFVIKAPAVENEGYGKQLSGIRFTPISFRQEQDDEKPSEDKGDEEGMDLSDVDAADLDTLDDKDDELDLEDDEQTPGSSSTTTWNLKPMSSISPRLRVATGKKPEDRSWQLTSRGTMPEATSDKLFAWASPDIRYQPLFFEDVALERYGQTKGFLRQPFHSGWHFLKSSALLPYTSLYDPINSCDGPLGYCRPGSAGCCQTQKHFFGNPFDTRR